jgi:ABC-2 type transport system permease protein
MRNVWTITHKELIHIVRDPKSLSLVLVLPVALLLLLGYAMATEIEDIPTAVYDQDKSDESRALLEKFWNSGYFAYHSYASSSEEIVEFIDSGEVRIGIIIPPNFAASVGVGKPVSVQAIIDGSDPSVAQTALFVAATVGQVASVEVISAKLGGLMAGGELRTPIEVRPRLLYNPDMKKINFMIPGLIGAILQMQTLLLTAFAIVREREQGTLEQLMVSPIRPWELMAGKIIPFLLVGFFNVLIALLISSFWFKVQVNGSLILLLALSLVFLLSSLGLGILISTVSRTQMQALHLASFIILPALVLSGFIVPRENMHRVAYYSSYFMPLTYYLVIVRGIVLKGVGLAYLWKQLVPLALFSLGVFGLSVVSFHKRLD